MKVTVSEAAKLLGVSSQFVRLGLQRGELPIGSAVKMSSVYTYHISPQLLDKYIVAAATAERTSNYDKKRKNDDDTSRTFQHYGRSN